MDGLIEIALGDFSPLGISITYSGLKILGWQQWSRPRAATCCTNEEKVGG